MIYFDSAATTLQKPAAVKRAVCRALDQMTSPGRGGHRASMLAAETAYRCREAAAELFHVENPAHIVFTHNATHGLNMAIKSTIRRGDRVVISSFEHNSVVRPLLAIGAVVAVARCEPFAQTAAVRAFEVQLLPETKLVVCNHVSNVFGSILPVERIAALCQERGIPFLLDASQSAGVLEIDATALGADFIAMPGHKGLYGPQGTGILICKEPPEHTLIEGGTGSSSLRFDMPDDLPDRLEAGTHNMLGISGLLEGLRFVKKRGVEEILYQERKLLHRLVQGLQNSSGAKTYVARSPLVQTGVLSFALDGIDCEAAAEALGAIDVAVRAGLHCSPLAHTSAGTLGTGTVRVSFSAFNTGKEVDRFLQLLGRIAKQLRNDI
ncbi:MAG: aminotransferase class V-fold PLP-dependent enzyme [Oscillospiraceae bacterium]|nr:aminotransferase class V-fold PLP-dependent enzyme [Oscillospiraceae bacterium]